MKTREELLADIKTWEGINKYIVDEAKAQIKLLDEKEAVPEPMKIVSEPLPDYKPEPRKKEKKGLFKK